MSVSKNEIVVYQPNETIRLDVRLENEKVWLTQSQMGLLFESTTRNVRLHLENIHSCGELTQEVTRKDFFLVRQNGAWQVKRQDISRQIFHHRRQGPVSYRASLKDLGWKSLFFTKLAAAEIPNLKARV